MDFIGYKEERDFSAIDSDKYEALRKYWANLFLSIWLPSSFYNKKTPSYDFRYDPNKINQKKESFGLVYGFPIEIASRINDFYMVKTLIENGADVTKAWVKEKNALYWSLCNMMLFLSIGFWRITIHPHSGEHFNEESLRNFIVPHWETTFQSLKNYKKTHCYERKKAYDIFSLIIQKYIETNNKPTELLFGASEMPNQNNEDLLSAVIHRIGLYDVITKLMNLYDINTFKKNNINYFYTTLGAYNQLWGYKNGGKAKNIPKWWLKMKEYSKKFLGINENTDMVVRGNQYVFNYYSSDYVFQSSCELIDVSELIKILKFLIENHFDPYIGVQNEPDEENDCVIFAIEMGWLEAIKLLCPYIMQNFPEKWEKYKEFYFSAGIYATAYPPASYPSWDTYKKIAPYLAQLLKNGKKT